METLIEFCRHNRRPRLLGLIFLSSIVLTGCGDRSGAELEIIHFPAHNLQGVIDRDKIDLDVDISSDGNGSFRIQTENPAVIRLYETGDIDAENCRLEYQAMIKIKDVKGEVYLEMWCHFGERGSYFSRDLASPLTGTEDWTRKKIPFFLKKGENPGKVTLNLVIDGAGTVWIDDIYLFRKSLP